MLTILFGDALTKIRELTTESIQCCVTSPPYWGLRDYGTASWEGGEDGCDHRGGRDNTEHSGDVGPRNEDGNAFRNSSRYVDQGEPFKNDCGKCGAKRIDSQLGLEKTPEEYVARMVEVFREVRRVLRNDGTLWLNLGDSYAGVGHGGGGSYEDERNWRSGSGRSDGIVDERSQRNRDELGRVSGLKPKDLCGIPWRVAFALQSDGWYLRQDIIWSKPNPMPESVTDRCTKAHEYLFLLTKSAKYYYDYRAILEPAAYDGRMEYRNEGQREIRERLISVNEQTKDVVGHERWPNKMPSNFKGSLPGRKDGPGQDRRSGNERIAYNQKGDDYGPNGQAFNQMHAVDGVPARNKRSVWTVTTQPYPDAHFATYPPDLIKPCIMAGSRVGDTVLDPFAGSGTTGMVALELGRKTILIELTPKYIELIEQRCNVTIGLALS